MKTSYLPQQIYLHSESQNNGSAVGADISSNDRTTDERSVTPILYGHHMIDLEGSKILKFKGCCWDGAEYNLDKYDIHLRSVLTSRLVKYVGDMFEMLVADLIFLVINILVTIFYYMHT